MSEPATKDQLQAALLQSYIDTRREWTAAVDEVRVTLATQGKEIAVTAERISSVDAKVSSLADKFDAFVDEQRVANEMAAEGRGKVHGQMQALKGRVGALERQAGATHRTVRSFVSVKRLIALIGASGVTFAGLQRETLTAWPWVKSHHLASYYALEVLGLVVLVGCVWYLARTQPRKQADRPDEGSGEC